MYSKTFGEFLILGILLFVAHQVQAFSECPNSVVSDPNVVGVNNCLTWMAYLQLNGQSPVSWCQNPSNYQKCCLTCQNYLQFGECKDIAYSEDCKLRASQGLCDLTLSDSLKLSSYCQKSCGRCQTPSLTCSNLVRNCNSGSCLSYNYYSIPTVQCICPYGKGGSYCQLDNPCNSNPCFNGGVCTPLYENDSLYRCSCPVGYSGNRCEYNPCSTKYCVNGGTCSVINGLPVCACPTGFTGPSCQTYTGACSASTCQNGGTCYVSNGLKCVCPVGYTGYSCQYQITAQLCQVGDRNTSLCQSWASQNLCDFKYLYQSVPIPLYCPITCRACDCLSTCYDINTNCGLWASLGLCDILRTGNPTGCKKSCNFC